MPKDKLSKTVLEKELTRYIKNGDTFTARNLLDNFAGENFPREKYLKLIEKAETPDQTPDTDDGPENKSKIKEE